MPDPYRLMPSPFDELKRRLRAKSDADETYNRELVSDPSVSLDYYLYARRHTSMCDVISIIEELEKENGWSTES